jgi:hypothetical protein
MSLAQDTAAEKPGFKVVCDQCGSLSIKLADPTKIASTTAIHCGRCNAVRGTLADLNHLARQSKDAFEF